MKHLREIYKNVVLPFAIISYGFIVPVVIGFFIAITFEMPRLLVMLMVMGLAILLYLDLIKSYERRNL